MATTDNRISWIKERISIALGLEDGLFDELLEREERLAEKELTAFCDTPKLAPSNVIVFYSQVSQVEKEIEIEEGE